MNWRPALFHKKALEAFRSFPKDVRHELGAALLDLQYGAKIGMPSSRPMPSVAPGVEELRVRDQTGIYRAFYTVRFEHAVLIFHAFQKKTQKTPLQEMELARKRLKEILHEQRQNSSGQNP